MDVGVGGGFLGVYRDRTIKVDFSLVSRKTHSDGRKLALTPRNARQLPCTVWVDKGRVRA